MKHLLLKFSFFLPLWMGAVTAPLAAPAAAPAEGTQDTDTSRESKAGDALSSGADPAAKPLEDRIKAVQHKKFLKRLRVEVFPWAGVTINDAFYQYYHTGVSGTFHIMEGLAVELGGSVAPVRLELPSVILLRQNKSAIPETARYYGNINGNLQLSPIYGKMALFSEWIVHYDMFVLGGLGAAFDSSEWYVHPQVTAGIGQRLFLLDWLVLRADLRGSLYPQNRNTIEISNVQNHITALVGVGFYLPPSFSYENAVGTKRK